MNGTKSQYLRWVEILEVIKRGRDPEDALSGFSYGRGLVNARYLSRKLGYSTKTILRDIEFLILHNRAPIEYDRVRHGYYLREPTFELRSGMVPETRIKDLAVAEMTLRVLGLEQLAESVAEVVDIVGKTSMGKISLVRERALMGLSVDRGLPEPLQFWKRLLNAAMERKPVRLQIANPDGTTAWRKFAQVRLMVREGGWHVVCQVEGEGEMAIEETLELRQVLNAQVYVQQAVAEDMPRVAA